MEFNVKLEMTRMPSFLRVASGEKSKRQDGFSPKMTIPIEQLTEQQALQYAEEMKEAFLNHYKKRKNG